MANSRPDMLVLSRKKNESIIINDDIRIVVVEIRGDKVRLGVECPKEFPVHRNEVYEAILRCQNKPAAIEDVASSSESVTSELDRPQSRARMDVIAKLGDAFKARRDAIRKSRAGDLRLLAQLSGDCESNLDDLFDEALFGAQRDVESQLAEVEQRELSKLEEALARIRSGTYGDCQDCGTQIPLARLNVLPYATTCLECQRLVELDSAAEPNV